jgi:hypothetical protein
MASRTKKKSTKRAPRKKTVSKAKKPSKKSILANKAAHWEAYKELQKRVDNAWEKLQADVKRKASPSVLIRNKNQLLLLLGECNYMARECMRFSSKTKKRK